MTDSDFFAPERRQLDELEQQGLLRALCVVSERDGPFVRFEGRRLLNLSSNDYLGFGGDRDLHRAFYAQLDEENLLDDFGLAGSASRLLGGNYAGYEQLEAAIAGAYGHDRQALVFGSGYHANLGILPAMADAGDLILCDKLCHASLLDGIRLSRAEMVRYRHLDYDQLRALLQKKRGDARRVFIVTESIFSMDGDLADLTELVRIKEEFDAVLYVDEAHAVGARGEHGLGLAEEQGVLDRIEILVGTFGKTLASLGAFALLNATWRDWLINRMRPFIFTTALPPVVTSWSRFVFERMLAAGTLRDRLSKLADRLRGGILNAGGATRGQSQIVPLLIGENEPTIALAEALRRGGFLVFPIRPPTVPPGTARLRLSLSAAMQWSDLQPLVELLPAGNL